MRTGRASGAGRRVGAPTPARSGSARAAAGRPRRGTPQGTRERLVAAAAEVINRVGYFGTDSNAIARAAGYSPATFYKHFVDKRAILLAAYEGWVSSEWRHIGERVRHATGGGNSPRVARDLTAWIVAHHRRWRGLRASLLGLVGADPLVRDFYVQRRVDQLEVLRALRGGRAARRGEREADAMLLFTFERTCDAIAGGEAEALGLDGEALQTRLVDLLAARLG